MRAGTVEVLLADDNPADAELIMLSLGENLVGRIHHVHDGEEALDFLFCRASYAQRMADAPPRLIVLDIKLPKLSGLEVLQEIKRDPRTRAIPVVLLTSSRLEADVAGGYQLGANSYVQKPVQFDRFRQIVRQLGGYWLAVNEPAPFRAFNGPSR
ncbi:MAG: response regulator [Gemmatimonadales bacterium]